MTELLLPLFPLKIVLFPRMNLPLHIFEERYKRMISDCLEHATEFGIVLANDEGLSSTGCTAAVVQLVKTHGDGRMDIIVRGSRRFEVLNLNRDETFLRGEVAFFDDEEVGEVTVMDRRRDEAVSLCNEVLLLIPTKDRNPSAEAPSRASAHLAFEIIAQVPVELAFRQLLLEMRNENERLDEVIEQLGQLKGFLSRLAATSSKAGSNGNGRH